MDALRKMERGMPRLYFSRWVSLVSGVYLMILSGSIYMFAVYSSDLKQIFGYSTEEINLVGTLGNVGTVRLLPPPLSSLDK
jgi:hypothetical protein